MSFPIVKLSQVLKLEYGKALPDVDRDIDGLYAAYGANGEKSRTNKFLYDKPSIIVGRKGSAGELTFVENKFWALDVTYYVTHNENESDLSYLYYALKTKNLTSYARGVKPGINRNDVYDLEIPLPPLATQQKIVAKLDVIFAEIDKATAAAEANAKNAEALYQSYLIAIFERGGEGWFELRLQDLLDKGWIVSHLDGNHGGDYPRKEEFISSGVPYISANCLDGDVLDLSKSKFLSKERASKLRKGLAKTDDVLFAHNATVGPVTILKTTEEVTILGTSLTYYRCNKDFIEPEYLANYMRSAKFKNQYLTIMRQSTRNQIPITKQREFFHVIPPLEKQKELLKNFNIFLSMKNIYELKAKRKINELFLLKLSILKKAFNGELVKE